MKDYIELHSFSRPVDGILVRKKDVSMVAHSKENKGCDIYVRGEKMFNCVETYDAVREMLEKKENTARGELKTRGMVVDPEDIAQLEEEE